jgi:hypothetical protein
VRRSSHLGAVDRPAGDRARRPFGQEPAQAAAREIVFDQPFRQVGGANAVEGQRCRELGEVDRKTPRMPRTSVAPVASSPRCRRHRMGVPVVVTCSKQGLSSSCAGWRGVPCLRSQRGAATSTRAMVAMAWATRGAFRRAGPLRPYG